MPAWARYHAVVSLARQQTRTASRLAEPRQCVRGPPLRCLCLQNAFLYASLYIVALGTGGIKPNVSAFGADQFDEADPQDRREKTSFFNWWALQAWGI